MSSRLVLQHPSRKNPVKGFIEQSSSRSPRTFLGALGRPPPFPLSSLSIADPWTAATSPISATAGRRQWASALVLGRAGVPRGDRGRQAPVISSASTDWTPIRRNAPTATQWRLLSAEALPTEDHLPNSWAAIALVVRGSSSSRSTRGAPFDRPAGMGVRPKAAGRSQAEFRLRLPWRRRVARRGSDAPCGLHAAAGIEMHRPGADQNRER